MKNRKNLGFTLVELIIVIIVIGILAALAIPQFMDSTRDAQVSTVRANLAVMRNSVNQYYHQHNSFYPGRKTTDGLGTDTSALNASAAFVDQLVQYTDLAGDASTSLDRATHPFGMYFPTGIPLNPLNNLNTVTALIDTDPIVALDIDGSTAWIFNVNTGEIRSNTTAADLGY